MGKCGGTHLGFALHATGRMDLFLWVLQAGGVSIAVLGLGRERWLRQRRSLRHSR